MRSLSFILLLLSCGLLNTSFAQSETVDVLYLENGSIIRGTIVELVPASTVKIRTSDGSVFVFEMDEVKRIESDESASVSPASASGRHTNPYRPHRRIAGAGLGASMAATLLGSLAMNDEYFSTTVIPIVGPWITMVRIEDDPQAGYLPGGRPLLIASGVTQGAFLTYFLVSLMNENSYESNASMRVAPYVNGVRFSYRF